MEEEQQTFKTPPDDIQKYESHYSKEKFIEKVKSTAKDVGVKGIYLALLLYYTLDSPTISLKDKVIIYGCLGYFICPIDLVPDFFPFMGFLDDIALLTWCFYKVKVNITEAIKEKAKTKLTTWFVDYDPKLIEEF